MTVAAVEAPIEKAQVAALMQAASREPSLRLKASTLIGRVTAASMMAMT